MHTASKDQQIKQCFQSEGYVALKGFLSPQEVKELGQEIDRYINQVTPHLPPEEVFYERKGQPETLKQLQRMFQHDDYFNRLFLSERITSVAELLLEGPVIGKNLQWFNKPGKISQPTPPHQDGYYFMITPHEAVTMWLALDEVDQSNGCIHYVPGSHRLGLRPHQRTAILGFSQEISDYGPVDRAAEVAIVAQPGDLLVHHSLTIHRADANASHRNRRALGFIYYSTRAQEDVERQHAYQRKLTKDLIKEGKL